MPFSTANPSNVKLSDNEWKKQRTRVLNDLQGVPGFRRQFTLPKEREDLEVLVFGDKLPEIEWGIKIRKDGCW